MFEYDKFNNFFETYVDEKLAMFKIFQLEPMILEEFSNKENNIST